MQKGTDWDRPVYSQLMMVTREAQSEARHDELYLKRVRAGDLAAWEPLVQRYQEAIFRMTYLTLRDGAEAEDVSQDCFIRAYKKLDMLAEGQPFKPWLFRMAINLARNRRRGLRRYWQQLQRWDRAQPEAALPGPEQLTAAGERADLLWQAVGQLSRKGQDVIYLRFFLELSEAETAAILSVPRGTVKSRLNRAQTQLRQVIQKDYPALLA